MCFLCAGAWMEAVMVLHCNKCACTRGWYRGYSNTRSHTARRVVLSSQAYRGTSFIRNSPPPLGPP